MHFAQLCRGSMNLGFQAADQTSGGLHHQVSFSITLLRLCLHRHGSRARFAFSSLPLTAVAPSCLGVALQASTSPATVYFHHWRTPLHAIPVGSSRSRYTSLLFSGPDWGSIPARHSTPSGQQNDLQSPIGGRDTPDQL